LNKVLKSILKAATYLLEQSDRFSGEMRDRVSEGVDRAGDRVSDLRDRARDLYVHEDHTVGNVLSFVAGAGVGVGVAILFAPAGGAQVRNSIAERIQAPDDQAQSRFSPEVAPTATGTKET
jgi:gas vesicle protein